MAFPFQMGLESTKMMEFLASLPEEELENFLQSVNDTADEFHEQNLQSKTQEGLIERFKKMRTKFTRPGGVYADLGFDAVTRIAFTSGDAKPKTNMRSLRTLKPMIVKELDAGTTHYGRYLCGFVAIDDAFFGVSSASLLLEDVTGRLVEIAVYGLVDANLSSHEKLYIVGHKFPKGHPIVVFEPFYKVRMDGSLGIRVEQATEIAPWQDVPTDMVTWKKLGNDFFSVLNTQNEGCGALACYQRAIQAMQPELRTLVLLLNNLATCRFKMGDFATSIQLSGVAAHLDPSYFKAWFRLASALVEKGPKSIAASVVAHVQYNLPLAPHDLQLLKSTFGAMHVSTDSSPFDSYAKWCTSLESPGFVLAKEQSCQGPKDADTWRKEGSGYFSTGDYISAEDCYRKGLALTTACRSDLSIVLNNVAAVYLTMRRENSDIPGISIGKLNVTSAKVHAQLSTTESALLNCTVAGLIDPLNCKAWVRRTRCLGYMGNSKKGCIADLKIVVDKVSTQVCTTAEKSKLFHEFKRKLDDNIQRRLRCFTDVKPAHEVSDVSTEVQRQQRHATHPQNLVSAIGREDEHEDDIDQYIAQMEKVEAMMCFALAASESQTDQRRNLPREMMMYVKDLPPQIHIEFPMLRGWPTGIEPVFARKILYRAYLDARASPWVTASSMREGRFFEKIDPADLVKRWHGTVAFETLAKKATSLKFGDIIARNEEPSIAVPAYDARIRSNFANNPNRAEAYFLGTTHVAIGFNDFSSLVTATIRDQLHNGMPLKFVGFEMSEFAVAKCKVVAQMLASPDVSISSVMEVWLSSTWSCSTLKDFRKCVKSVLESLRGRNSNLKVMTYLNHWASVETISATKAHTEFFANLRRYSHRVLIGLHCFRRVVDRLDLTQYMLTGEVRASSRVMNIVEKEQSASTSEANVSKAGKSTSKKKRRHKKEKAKKGAVATPSCSNAPLVGSLTMWNVPPGAPPLEEDVAFNTVDFMKILENFEEREKKQKHSTDDLSVVDLFIIHIMRNLHRLRELMTANKLSIEVNYGVVKAVRGKAATDPENLNLLARIALMRPFTISWSNVLDYFVPEDFHDLARRCSIFGDCVHYGYSMNWTTQVFGASLLDYDPTHHKALIDSTLDAALGFLSETSLSKMLTVLGLDKLLHLPFRENPLNSTGYVLACIHQQKWINYFMDKGKLSPEAAHRLGVRCTPSNSVLQAGAMELAIPSPLDRSSLTLYMSWCYDPKLRLQMVDLGATDTDKLARIEQLLNVQKDDQQVA
ncbi:hypothetical protein DD238_004754 [Peronospora effusa]|uniref:Uncharacterized protein n=1 Tax=Peronospora effusa TaxID=542832 RepID=A0A3M6VG80_9STRA|nr:hypothetical protein DD238_004754 [Peronospora effusa]